MALTKDDKEYLDLKFKPILNHLKHINGDVQKHTIQIDSALLERGANRNQQLHEFEKLDKIAKKVDGIDSTLIEYKMIKKYPKMFAFMSVCFILWLGWEVIQNVIIR
jgi:hypothetical protein